LPYIPPGAAHRQPPQAPTQPLLFGHAFINQKDTPFMGFFVLSVVVGLAVVDRLGRSLIEGEQAGGNWRGLREAWSRVRGVRK